MKKTTDSNEYIEQLNKAVTSMKDCRPGARIVFKSGNYTLLNHLSDSHIPPVKPEAMNLIAEYYTLRQKKGIVVLTSFESRLEERERKNKKLVTRMLERQKFVDEFLERNPGAKCIDLRK